MLIGMGVLAADIIGQAGGLSSLMQKINQEANAGQAQAFFTPTSSGALPWTLLFSSWILVGFATVALPQSAVRCMAYRRTEDLHLAMVVSTAVCGALMIGMTLLGFLARGVIPDATVFGNNTDAMIPYLISHHMNPWVAGITLVAPIAATMSTVSSLLIAASSAIIKDLFLKRYGNIPDKGEAVSENYVTVEDSFYESAREVRKKVIDLERKTLFGYQCNHLYKLNIVKEHSILFRPCHLYEDYFFNLSYIEFVSSMAVSSSAPVMRTIWAECISCSLPLVE